MRRHSGFTRQGSSFRSSDSDIHNLCDSPGNDAPPFLAGIEEENADGKTSQQSRGRVQTVQQQPGRKRLGTHGLARLTTQEFQEQKDIVKMRQK